MVRLKCIILIIVVGLCLSACGENTVIQETYSDSQSTTINNLPSTTQSLAVTTPSPAQNLTPVTLAVTTFLPNTTKPYTTMLDIGTTARPSVPAIGTVYFAQTKNGGISWTPLITQTNTLKEEYSGFDKLQCVVMKDCAHIKIRNDVDYPFIDLVRDGSKNWKPFVGLYSVVLNCLTPDECWRLVYSGSYNEPEVAFSKDQGANWIRLTRDENLKVNEANKEIYLKARRNSEIASELAFAHSISCVNSSKCLLTGGGGRSIRTVDGGKTWNWFFTEPAFYFNSICPGELICYAIARDRVSITTNFGETWQRLNISTGINELKALSCLSENDCVVISDKANLYWTNDKGLTWTEQTISTKGGLLDVSCPGENSCYVLTSNKELWVTRDAGKTWNSRPINMNITLNYYGKISCPAANNCLITNRAY